MTSNERSSGRVLLVGGDEWPDDIVATLETDLDGTQVRTVAEADEALAALAETDRACLVVSFGRPDRAGLTLLRRLGERADAPPAVAVDETSDADRAERALDHGALDYVARDDPAALVRLSTTVARALARGRPETGPGRSGQASNERALRRFHRIVADASRSLDEQIRALLELGCERLGLTHGFLMRTDEDRLTVEYGGRVDDADAPLSPGESVPLEDTYCRKTGDVDGLLAIRDASADGWAADPAHERFGLGCYIGGAVTVDGDQYGTLCFVAAAGRDRTFTGSERAFVELLVQWVSLELERRRDERHLERQRDLFRRTQRLADIGAWELDLETDELRWTEGTRRIHGTSSDFEATTDEALAFYHPDDRDAIESAIERAITERETYELEARLETRDGDCRWVQTRGEPQVEDGRVVRIRGTIRDITERKEWERTLREQQERIDAIVGHIPVALFTLDEDGLVTQSQGHAFDRLGLPADELIGRSVFDLADDDHRIASTARRALDGEAGQSTLAVNDRTLDVWYHPITEDGHVTQVVALALDVTDRERRLRELETYERMFNTAGDGIYHLDPDGRFLTTNDANCELTGYDRDELLGEQASILMSDADVERAEELIVDLLADDDRSTDAFEMEIHPKRGDPIPVENRMTVLQDDEGTFHGTVGVVRDITAQKAHEETLTALHDITSDLLRAGSRGDIGDEVVRAAERILDFDAIAVFGFDDDENHLAPVAYSDRTVELIGEVPTFGPGDGIAWDVFVEGEGRVYDDVRVAENVHDPETPVRTEILIPLGEHGVLIAGNATKRDLSDRTLELVQILAANCEAALARTEREAALRERDRELQSRNERLTRLNDINETIRTIDRTLVDAESRAEIEAAVCERLAAFEDFEFAWLGAVDPISETVEPGALAGLGRGYLDDVDRTLGSPEPAIAAADTGERQVVSSVADHLHEEAWAKDALSRDLLSVTAVPLVHDGVQYGVLAVYADRAAAFDEHSHGVIEDLADVVASALNAVERRRALLGDAATELDFRLPSLDTPLFGVAAELDGALTVDSLLAQPDGGSLAYVTVSTDATGDAIDRLSDLVGVDGVRDLGHTDDGEQRLEVRLQGETVVATVTEHGGRVTELSIDDHHGSATVSLPDRADVRGFIDRFSTKFPDAEFVARRRRTFETSADEPIDRPLESLTPRQTEALRVAHHGGFFEWPRESSGEELADTLGVSPPTFLEHLRRAEAKLVDHLLDAHAPVRPADD